MTRLNIEARERILAMFKMPDEWLTTGEVATRAGISRPLAIHYLHMLQSSGFIARAGSQDPVGSHGRKEYVWRQKSLLTAGAF